MPRFPTTAILCNVVCESNVHYGLTFSESSTTFSMLIYLYVELNALHTDDMDCNPSPDGRDYVGNTSVTVNGRTCQAWTSQSPHRHINFNRRFPDGSAVAAVNYCRNPSGWYKGLWCYTTDPNKRWEACDVPDCGQSLSYVM